MHTVKKDQFANQSADDSKPQQAEEEMVKLKFIYNSHNRIALPSEGSYIYALWDIPDLGEKTGWYLAKITSIAENFLATIRYRSKGSLETIHLNEIQWSAAKGNGKWSSSFSSLPPSLSPNFLVNIKLSVMLMISLSY